MESEQPHHHHHGDHPHHHGGNVGRYLLWSLLITLGYAIVETLAGFWSGSLTLLGDAGHMFTDAMALGLAAAAAWLALRPPSPRHSYGLGRAEVIAAILNALFMLAVITAIAVEAVRRLHQPQQVDGGIVMSVAGFGLAMNMLVALILSRGHATLNVRAALLHVIGDMLGSIAALIAGAVIRYTGWTPIDPILALFVCVLILWSTLHLLRDSLHVVMEGVPLHLDLPSIGRAMAGVPRVHSVHDLHIWTLASGTTALSAHVVLDDLRHWEAVLADLRRLLHDRYGIEHSTLQPETRTRILHPMKWEPPPSKQ